MIQVRLLGDLGKRFGKVHRFAVGSTGEAIRALCANFPGFDRYMIESGDRGVGYKVLNNRAEIDLEQVHDPISRSLTIAPVVTGAGGALGKILLGAALIAVAFIPGLNVAVFAGGAATYASVAFSIGVSLALGGVAQLLAPQPPSNDPRENQTEASYLFDGPINTTAQGQAVPVGYGRLIVGSAIISAGVDVSDFAGA